MKKNSFIVATIFTCIILFLTVGYSSFNTELNIDNMVAYYRAHHDIRITGISVDSVESDALSEAEEYDDSSIAFSLSLPNADSSINYLVDVTNLGGTYMVISKLSGLPSNLTYELSNYELNHVLCDSNNNCTLGSTKPLLITIKYKDGGYNESSTLYNVILNFEFSEFTYTIYYDGGFVLPNEYQEVEYIESTRNQRVNTTYIPKTTTSFELDVSFSGTFTYETNQTNSILSSKSGVDSFSINFGDLATQGNTLFGWFDKNYGDGAAIKKIVFNDTIRTNRNTLKYSKGVLSYGSVTASSAIKTADNTEPIYLFGSARSNFDRYEMKVYSLKFYEDDVLVAHYIPCYRKSDGKTGMYDIIGRYFTPNIGSGEFNIGPEVSTLDLVVKNVMDKQVVKYNEATNLRLNRFVMDRHMFVNWNTKRDGSGSSFSDGASIFNLSDVSGTEYYLHAQWADVILYGSGTADKPYLLNTIEDWVRFSNQVNVVNNTYEGMYIKMTRDLDFNDINSYEDPLSTEFGDINGDGVVSGIKTELTTGLGFPSIGKVNEFKGYFDGSGYTLSNLYIYNSSVGQNNETLTGAVESGYLSLFTRVNGGRVGYINVNGSITSKYPNNIGGIVGVITSSVIERVNTNVSVTLDCGENSSTLGGIVAYSFGNSKILSSGNYGNVLNNNSTATNKSLIGGVISNHEGTLIIRDTFNHGNVTYGWRVGGISAGVTTNDSVLIVDRCYNLGTVQGILATGSGQNVHTGGIVGLLWASTTNATAYVINSYNMGIVNSGIYRDASGLIGSIASKGIGYIINSYNSGSITALKTNSQAAGLTNNSNGPKAVINNAFNVGTVKGVKTSYGVGYLIVNKSFVTNTYYNNAIKGSNLAVGTGMALADFNSQTFVDTLNNNLNSISLDTMFDRKLATDYGVRLSTWRLGDRGYPELIN